MPSNKTKIPGGVGELVRLVDHEDLEAADRRLVGRAFDEIADLVLRERTSVALLRDELGDRECLGRRRAAGRLAQNRQPINL